jgi:D-sedoheptulose 7-phosphate isomerase
MALSPERKLFASAITDLKDALDKLDDSHFDQIMALATDVHGAWLGGGKLLVCGNGGSAADSQHIVAELVGRFMADRPGYAAIALTANTSILTAVGNDYGFDAIFSRQVQGLGNPGDVLLVISTSGNSTNCITAVAEARQKNMKVHGFLGKGGGELLPLLDGALVAPSNDTPKIQEIHITMGHLLCMILERMMTAHG